MAYEMTHTTLSIQLYSKSVAYFCFTSSTAESEPIFNLNDMARQCQPYRLADWAQQYNLGLFYVDNCWVRVPVSRSDLAAFADDIRAKPNIFNLLRADRGDGSTYSIEAEEF